VTIRDDKLRLVGWVGTPETVQAEYEQDGCASIHPEEDRDHPIPVFRVLLIDGVVPEGESRPCPDCDGTGELPDGYGRVTCDRCAGSGTWYPPVNDGYLAHSEPETTNND
jgi:hypothetical protein